MIFIEGKTMQKGLVVLLAGLLAVVLSTVATYARPGKRYDKSTDTCRILTSGKLNWDSDHWGKGAQKFKEVCKSCHTRNNDKGAKFLYMESFSSKGWNAIFAKKRKKCAQDGSWDVLSKEELLAVNDYLYRNANDTYDPNDADTCG